jgi:hypothetical protein
LSTLIPTSSIAREFASSTSSATHSSCDLSSFTTWRDSTFAAVGPQEAGIDFAVKDSIVHQLSQVWAFDVKDTRHLQTQIRAWNYLVGLLRVDGGTLAKKGRPGGVEIPRRVKINAVFTAPTSADGERQFEIARDGWHRLGVEAIASSDSESIVDEAARLLTASNS